MTVLSAVDGEPSAELIELLEDIIERLREGRDLRMGIVVLDGPDGIEVSWCACTDAQRVYMLERAKLSTLGR